MKLLIAVTGASGMIFLKAFVELCRNQDDLVVHGICSDAGKDVIKMELGQEATELVGVDQWFGADDFFAPPASGSADYGAMVILPCSMGTLAAISSGLSINLIHRAADVLLKERKKVVLGVRETPLNRTHLSNMLKVHDAGAVICPPMPSYYFRPKTLDEAATSYGWRVMDQLGIEITGRKRWGEV
ncbi:MAG: UbiX family flavin prenyltransferase [Desulfocapsaceae bacterium]